jgi:IS4 transposase
MAYRVVKRRIKKREGKILRNDEVVLTDFYSGKNYPRRLRRVEALVEVDGKERVMVFLTNNLQWTTSSGAELYRCRWQIECFFKPSKQTLQLGDFLGSSANAVHWQLCCATCCCATSRM